MFFFVGRSLRILAFSLLDFTSATCGVSFAGYSSGMEAKVGQRVQAVDQLGRWEDAKVVSVAELPELCTVKFVGWNEEYNKAVRPGVDMRVPVEPIYGQEKFGKCLYVFFLCYSFVELDSGGCKKM